MIVVTENRDMTGRAVRDLARTGRFTEVTSGVALGYVQANLVERDASHGAPSTAVGERRSRRESTRRIKYEYAILVHADLDSLPRGPFAYARRHADPDADADVDVNETLGTADFGHRDLAGETPAVRPRRVN